MKKAKRYPKVDTCYAQSNALDTVMTELLEYSEKQKVFEENVSTSGRSEEIVKEKRRLKADKTKLNRKKVHVLNKHIFPAMANLTVLLEGMTRNAYLDYVFRDDVKALFFAKSAVNKNMKNAYIFWRFINAICALNISKHDIKTGKPVDNFRLILYDIMQERMDYWMVSNRAAISRFIFNDDDGFFVEKTLYPDMDRARAWTRMFASGAYEDLKVVADTNKRPPQF